MAHGGRGDTGRLQRLYAHGILAAEQGEVAADVRPQRLGVGGAVFPPAGVEPVAEAIGAVRCFGLQNQAVGDVNELAAVVLIEKRRQRAVRKAVQRRNFRQVCRCLLYTSM